MHYFFTTLNPDTILCSQEVLIEANAATPGRPLGIMEVIKGMTSVCGCVRQWICDHPEEHSFVTVSVNDVNQHFMKNDHGPTCPDSSSATPGVKGLKTHNSAWEWKKTNT